MKNRFDDPEQCGGGKVRGRWLIFLPWRKFNGIPEGEKTAYDNSCKWDV